MRIAGIHSDLSGQAALEQELQQTQKLGTLGLMAGRLLHDLNNMLTVVIGYGRLWRDNEQLPERIREGLAAAGDSGERAAALIRPLLAFSREQEQPLTAVALNDVLTEFERLLQSVLSAEVELALDLDAQLEKVHASPNLLQQLILNLAVNVRAGMRKPGRMVIATSHVHLENSLHSRDYWLPRGDYALLTISGLEPQKGRPGGSHPLGLLAGAMTAGQDAGVGLASVRAVLKQLGGAAVAASQTERGSLVRVYLPLDRPAVAETGREVGRPAAGPRAEPARDMASAGTRLPILVVDDEPAVVKFVSRILHDAGFETVPAKDGKEALSILRREPMALIVTDLVMPNMEGMELIMELRRRHPALPVMAISGAFGGIYLETALALGVQAALAKPFSAEQLVEKVRGLLPPGTPGAETK